MGKKKMLMRKFGSVAIVNNTFIGGVASVINTPALLAAKLEYYPSGLTFSENDIQNFTINGSDIECYIGVDYQVANDSFNLDYDIIHYKDNGGFCKIIGAASFKGNVASLNKLSLLYFPEVVGILGSFFVRERDNCIIVIPKCTSIGLSVLDDVNFALSQNQKIYANPILQTINGGAEEGDLAYARSQGSTIIYVTNFTAPNPVTDLSVNTVYATAIKLDWSAPTSTNAIYFYEVYVDGVFYQNSSVNEIIVGGLTNSQTYNFSVITVDSFYNKSEMSNIVTQPINGVGNPVFSDPSSIISYYKFENNVLDSVGANNGVATDITYASGQVGNAAVFNGSSSQVLIGDSSSFNINNDSTVSMPIYLTNVANKQCPFEYGTYTSWGTMNIQVGGEIWFYYTPDSGGSFLIFKSVAKVLLNQWTLITLVRDYTNGFLKWYFNASEVASIATGETRAKQSTGDAFIGSGYAGKVNGLIDDTPIFNKALSQAEVTEMTNIRNAGFPLI